MQETGLFAEWEKLYVPLQSESKCMKINQRDDKPRVLSLKHLSSAFAILIAGYLTSLVIFVVENIMEKLIRFHRASRFVTV